MLRIPHSRCAFTLAVLSLALALSCDRLKNTSKSLSGLSELYSSLTERYGTAQINVNLFNDETLAITFISAGFPELSRRNQEIALFALSRFSEEEKVKQVAVNFVENKQIFVFNYTVTLDSAVFDRKSLMDIGAQSIAPEAGVNGSAQPVGASSRYTKSRREMYLQTDPMLLYGVLDNGLVLIASAVRDVANLTKPAAILLDFASYSRKPEFAANHKLAITADRQKIFEAEARLTSSGKLEGGMVAEFLQVDIPVQQFSQAVAGQRIVVLLGDKGEELSPLQADVLRDLQKCLDKGRCVRHREVN